MVIDEELQQWARFIKLVESQSNEIISAVAAMLSIRGEEISNLKEELKVSQSRLKAKDE